jgi:transposase
MTKIEKICGIDISKKTFDVSISKDGEIRSKKFTYDTLGMQSFLQFLPEGSHCVMESTGTYHCRLAYFLHEHGVILSVVNPLSVKRYAQSLMLRAKTDKADSRLLISYGKNFDLVLWQPREDCYIELQQLLNLQSQLIVQDKVWANQLEAISHSVVKNKLTIERLLEKRDQIKAE